MPTSPLFLRPSGQAGGWRRERGKVAKGGLFLPLLLLHTFLGCWYIYVRRLPPLLPFVDLLSIAVHIKCQLFARSLNFIMEHLVVFQWVQSLATCAALFSAKALVEFVHKTNNP